MEINIVGIRGFPNIQGGVEKHCEELYPRLAKLGCRITVFCRSPYFTKEKTFKKWKGVKFIYLWCPRIKSLEAITHTLLASLICVSKRPDIVHMHNIGPGMLIPLLKMAKLKVVLTYHSANYEHQKWGKFAKIVLRMSEFISMRFADRIIVVSKVIKNLLKNKYRGEDLELISNGISFPEKVSTTEILEKYQLSSGKYVFAAARFVPEKGLHDLIAAYLEIKKPEFKLVIAGAADHETKYSRKIKALARKSKKVILTGFISGKPLAQLFSNAGLFVLPSYYEGLPIALLEAMSHGIPALISDIPANKEMPLPEFRFFPVGNIDKLSKKMIELFKYGLPEKERQRQREVLIRHYNWDKIAKQTFRVYEKMQKNR